jgi:hypothetical protein
MRIGRELHWLRQIFRKERDYGKFEKVNSGRMLEDRFKEVWNNEL